MYCPNCRYLNQIEHELNLPTGTGLEIGSRLQEAVQKTFIGKMLLFGFKLQANYRLQTSNVPQEDKSSCSSTLGFAVQNSVSVSINAGDVLQSTWGLQSQTTSSEYAKLPTLIAFQTIDPNPTQEYLPVINLFKHELACIIQRHQHGDEPAENTCRGTPNGTPVYGSFCRSANWSVQSSGTASFWQGSLMLSCDIETSGEESSVMCTRTSNPWSIGNNEREYLAMSAEIDATFSPVEIVRAGSSSDSSYLRETHLDGADFDETRDPDATSSGTQGESLIATQSQHLSQDDAESSQYGNELQKDAILEQISCCEPHLTAGNGTNVASEHTSRGQNKDSDSAEFPYINGDNSDTTINEATLNDSELLLACENRGTQTKVDNKEKNILAKEDKGIVKTHLNIKDICDSFDAGDSELLLAADMLNAMNVDEQVEVVPDITDLDPQLPHSEGLDSFLQSQKTNKSNFIPKQLPGIRVECKHETNSVHRRETLPDSEDIFLESEIINNVSDLSKESSMMASVQINREERINYTETTKLPDSESLDQFLNVSQNLNTKISNAHNITPCDNNTTVQSSLLCVSDSEGLESFLKSDGIAYSKMYCAKHRPSCVQEQLAKSSLESTVDVTTSATANIITVWPDRTNEQLENSCTKIRNEVAKNLEVEEVTKVCGEEILTIGGEENLKGDISCQNSLKCYSNDLFSGSECDISVSIKEDNVKPDDSNVIPDSQFSQHNNLMTESSVPKSERRKSVHFARKLLECENISGIDQQMRTTPLVNAQTTRRKSCLKYASCAPNLPYSPVIADKNDEFLSLSSQDVVFTPSPEIITTVLRQIGNTSYQSTPLTNLRNTQKLKKSVTLGNVSPSRFSKHDQESMKENTHVDYSSQELFSENSCDLFSTSCSERRHNMSFKRVCNQVHSSTSFSSQNVIPKSTCANIRYVSNISQLSKSAVSPEIHKDIEMLSINSEELFSNGSLTDYYGETEDICKKLF